MDEVTIKDLRDHGDEVIGRVVSGERLMVMREGRAVAELRPVAARPLPVADLLRRWRRLQPLDATAFRHDLEAAVDPRL